MFGGQQKAVMAVGIDVYGLVNDRCCFTRLAGAMCHLPLLGVPATHHSVVLLGAVPEASCWQTLAAAWTPRAVQALDESG